MSPFSNLVYLASPYSKYPGGREEAFHLACKKAAQLMEEGYKVFCPIAHSHPIEAQMSSIKDGDFWLDQDFAVLDMCDKVMVYQMPGWQDSVGVKAEIQRAIWEGITIEYIPWEGEQLEMFPTLEPSDNVPQS